MPPGLRLGLPRGPCTAGIDSSSAGSCVSSLTLAAVVRTTSGTPSASVSRWRLQPFFARSVGLGPVCGPPLKRGRTGCRPRRAPGPRRRPCPGGRAVADAAPARVRRGAGPLPWRSPPCDPVRQVKCVPGATVLKQPLRIEYLYGIAVGDSSVLFIEVILITCWLPALWLLIFVLRWLVSARPARTPPAVARPANAADRR